MIRARPSYPPIDVRAERDEVRAGRSPWATTRRGKLGSARERRAEPRLLDLPEAVLAAVDVDHRHPVAVLGLQLGRRVDVHGPPGLPELAADAGDLVLRLGAGRAAHPRVD